MVLCEAQVVWRLSTRYATMRAKICCYGLVQLSAREWSVARDFGWETWVLVRSSRNARAICLAEGVGRVVW